MLRLRVMKSIILSLCIATVAVYAAEVAEPTLIGWPAGDSPRCKHRDFALRAGKHSPEGCYPQLVRVEKNGRAVFRLEQGGPVFVAARAGDQIPEGESDFYGVVLRVDPKRQTAVIREYDLSRPL